MKQLFALIYFLFAPALAGADVVWPADTDVLILGEVHDNPAHHTAQADMLARLAPRAVVFEMLTTDQADRVTPELLKSPDALLAALDWESSGWPDFSMYYPVFASLGAAQVYGALVPRGEARKAMEQGAAAVFGPGAADFGLDRPLPDAQQKAREAMQQEAHCNALPEDMLPMMVEMQRLRDARLARAVALAMAETGGPVAVITGNGHARRDWGLTAYLLQGTPTLRVFAVGQIEEGQDMPEGFDAVLTAPPVDRPDPCEAFRKG